MDEIKENDLVTTALNNFNLSFLPTLSAYFSLNILYSVIEMLYGRISSKICKSTSHYNRALAVIQSEYGNLNEDDAWFIFFTEQIHPLRISVHHHKSNDLQISLQEAKIYLQESTRLGIRILMRLYILNSMGKLEDVKEGLPLNIKPKEILNLALEHKYHGDHSYMEKILTNY